MLKILYAGCFGLSSGISSQFTLEMCLQPKIAKNLLQTPFLWVVDHDTPKGHRLKVVGVDKCKKPVTSACYDKQHVCTYLQSFSTRNKPITAK